MEDWLSSKGAMVSSAELQIVDWYFLSVEESIFFKVWGIIADDYKWYTYMLYYISQY